MKTQPDVTLRTRRRNVAKRAVERIKSLNSNEAASILLELCADGLCSIKQHEIAFFIDTEGDEYVIYLKGGGAKKFLSLKDAYGYFCEHYVNIV